MEKEFVEIKGEEDVRQQNNQDQEKEKAEAIKNNIGMVELYLHCGICVA